MIECHERQSKQTEDLVAELKSEERGSVLSCKMRNVMKATKSACYSTVKHSLCPMKKRKGEGGGDEEGDGDDDDDLVPRAVARAEQSLDD